MQIPSSLDALGILLAFVWPGTLSLQVYRIIMPARPLEWKDSGQALFYSTINYIVFFPAAVYAIRAENLEAHQWLYWACIVLLLLVGPILLAVAFKYAHRWGPIGRLIQAPYPTSWDYFFSRRRTAFVLIHLRDGNMVGGYWGPTSYASSFPHDGDVYIRVACKVDAAGNFVGVVDRTLGILIRREEFTYVEFFDTGAGTITLAGGEDEKGTEGLAVGVTAQPPGAA